MLALKQFRDKARGVADILNWSHLTDDGIVLCKDGSLLAGWFYRGPDNASSTNAERVWLSERVNAALAKLGGGWASWVDAARLPASDYPAPEASHFPDPVSRLVDAERRLQFMREGAHLESEYAIVVQYMPPLRRQSKIADLIYDDDPERAQSPADRILDGFRKSLDDIEDQIGDAVQLRRMRSYTWRDAHGRAHLRDELVNYLQFSLTLDEGSLNVPPGAAYLDCVLGGAELWGGDTPRLGDKFIACVAIEGFPQASTPGILEAIDHLAIPFRWSSRFIWLDQHEAVSELKKYRRKWKQRVRGFWAQVFKTQGGAVNEDAALAVAEVDAALARTRSGLVGTGYYTSVIVLMDEDREQLLENSRRVAQVIRQEGFTCRVESVNTMEAWLGSQPGHSVPNVRRPPLHTDNLSDLLPLAGVWTGRAENPCPFYPPGSPPLLHAATTGATPFRLNLHVSDVGHTLIFGPTGAGKSTLLCTVALQARRYAGATICAFDKGRSMLATAKACGGQHYDVGKDGSLSFCPLSDIDTDADAAWAEDWIGTCFELQTGRAPVPDEKREIRRAIRLLRQPGELRSLSHFQSAVQNQAVRDAMSHYTETLGHLLDAEHDGLADANFWAFEMEELMGMGEANLAPVLLYLFRRFAKMLKGQPAYLILDEAWVFLRHPLFREKIREWLKEMRKANCVVILATQSLSDARSSGLIDVLMESCPSKIFLPNPEAENPGPREQYESMGLNETQIGIIRSATQKRHYYLVSPEGRRLFELGLGPVALSFAAASSKEDIAAIKRLEERDGSCWPVAWLEQRGVEYASLQ